MVYIVAMHSPIRKLATYSDFNICLGCEILYFYSITDTYRAIFTELKV